MSEKDQTFGAQYRSFDTLLIIGLLLLLKNVRGHNKLSLSSSSSSAIDVFIDVVSRFIYNVYEGIFFKFPLLFVLIV